MMKFLHDSKLAGEMAPRCREASATFSFETYGHRLIEVIQNSTVPKIPL
jgi:hypothetical protein